MLKRVLAAIDGSLRSTFVIARASEISRLANAKLRVFRAVAVPPEFPAAAATQGDHFVRHLLAEAREGIRTLAAEHGVLDCEIVVGQSHHPPQAILDAAEEYDADLVVIGSHGYELIDRLLGTTAAKVVNLSTRDVLVVHDKS